MAASALATKGSHAAPPVTIASDGLLPVDMLCEVLLRLPADAICRLRLVCGSWRSITSEPLFTKVHSSRHRHVVALRLDPREIHVLDLYGNIVKRIRMVDQYVMYMSSQLDLVTVSGSSPFRPANVFNLVTGAAAVLHGDLTSGHGARMVCPPRYMLGYVSSTKDYKMLCGVHSYAEDNGGIVQLCHVMTPADTRWRAAPQPPLTAGSYPWKMAAVGGMAYFLPNQQYSANIEVDSVALFDFVTEKWSPTTLHGLLTILLASTGQKLRLSNAETCQFQLSCLCGCLVMVHQNY